MTDAPSVAPAPITALGRLRIAVRLPAMVLLLALCVTCYYPWRLLGPHNPWPRIFLGGIAWLAGVDVRTTGPRNRRGAFLLANHVSWTPRRTGRLRSDGGARGLIATFGA